MAHFIPPEFIEELNRRLDIVDLVGRYVSLKKQGRNFVGLCPFHSEDTPSFIVSPEKQIFHCFGCHKGGNAINFLMGIENLTFPEAIEKLASMQGMDMPRQEITPEEKARIAKRQNYFKLNDLARDFYQDYLWSKQGEKARAYLENRGMSPDLVKKFALGYAPDQWDSLLSFLLKKGYNHRQIEDAGLITLREGGNDGSYKGFDRFRHRVMFPILDFKGQVIAFGGRMLDNQPNQAKYLNSPETAFFHKSQNLYGLFTAGNQIRRMDEAVIMEGYMDVITGHQYGVENAIASLGTAFTKEHGTLLRRYTNRVLLAYDGDSAGVKAANKAMDILKEQGSQVRVVHFPDDLDPDDFLRKYAKPGWEALVQDKALDYWEYKLQDAMGRHDLNTVSGKGALVTELLPFIAKCKNQVERDGFIALLAKTVGVNVEAIYSDLNKQGLKTGGRPQERQTAGREQTGTPASVGLDRKQANLVLFLLYQQEIFDEVEKKLGLDFAENQLLQELVSLVQKIKEKYNWQPATLFSYLDEGETKQLLLRMLSADVAEPGSKKFMDMARGVIKSIQIDRLQQAVEAKQKSLQTTVKKEDTISVLQEIKDLQQQIQQLRQ